MAAGAWAAGCWWGTGGYGAAIITAAVGLALAAVAGLAGLGRAARLRRAVRLDGIGAPPGPRRLAAIVSGASVPVALVALGVGMAYGALAARPPEASRLTDHPRGLAGPWQVRGRLASEPIPLGNAWQVDLHVATIHVDGVWRHWPLRVRTTVYAPAPPVDWPAGSGFEAFLALRPQRGARNPLVAQLPALAAAGADVRASLKSFHQLRRRHAAPTHQRWRSTVRAALRRQVEARFGSDAPLVHALLLGERARLDDGLDDVLARTGLVHLLAISGLHVGIVVSAGFALLRASGLARPHAALALATSLPLLHALVVPRPPVARASLMAGVMLLGIASGRRGTAGNGLALATLVLIAADPWVVRNFGFQLSSAATAAILLTARPPSRRTLRGWLRATLMVSIAAQLAVAPLITAASFRLPLASLPLNLPAVPLTATALIGAIAALLAAALRCEPAAALAGAAVRAALAGVRQLAGAADHRVDPLTVPAGATAWVAATTLGMLALYATRSPPAEPPRQRAAAIRRAGVLATAVLVIATARAITTPAAAPVAGFRLVAFDAGQGDALLVETSGRRVLVDTSGSPGSDFDPGTALLAPALRARGADRLDAVIISHLHADHAGGLAGLLQEIDAGAVWTAPFDPGTSSGRALTAAIGEVPLRIATAGSALELRTHPSGSPRDSCRWQVLHPPAAFRPFEGRPQGNDDSLVVALRCRRRAVLLTGDTEHRAEADYTPALVLPRGTVLKSPHHGSATSSGETLLDAAAPRHVVIPVGWRNRFGLPDAEVLERYRARRIAVYRTDRDGAVTLTAGTRIRVTAERWTAGRGRHTTGGWLH